MNEYEQLFTEDVWNRLKKRLKGKIFAGIRNDVMKVSFKCDECYLEKIEEDMAKKSVTGKSKSPCKYHTRLCFLIKQSLIDLFLYVLFLF